MDVNASRIFTARYDEKIEFVNSFVLTFVSRERVPFYNSSFTAGTLLASSVFRIFARLGREIDYFQCVDSIVTVLTLECKNRIVLE